MDEILKWNDHINDIYRKKFGVGIDIARDIRRLIREVEQRTKEACWRAGWRFIWDKIICTNKIPQRKFERYADGFKQAIEEA